MMKKLYFAFAILIVAAMALSTCATEATPAAPEPTPALAEPTTAPTEEPAAPVAPVVPEPTNIPPMTAQQIYDSLNINQPGWESKVTINDAIISGLDNEGNLFAFKVLASSLYEGLVLPEEAKGVTIVDIYTYIEKNKVEKYHKMHAENACTSVRFMNDDEGVLYWSCGSTRIDPVPVDEATDQFGVLLQKIRGKDNYGYTEVKITSAQHTAPNGGGWLTIPAWEVTED